MTSGASGLPALLISYFAFIFSAIGTAFLLHTIGTVSWPVFPPPEYNTQCSFGFAYQSTINCTLVYIYIWLCFILYVDLTRHSSGGVAFYFSSFMPCVYGVYGRKFTHYTGTERDWCDNSTTHYMELSYQNTSSSVQ